MNLELIPVKLYAGALLPPAAAAPIAIWMGACAAEARVSVSAYRTRMAAA